MWSEPWAPKAKAVNEKLRKSNNENLQPSKSSEEMSESTNLKQKYYSEKRNYENQIMELKIEKEKLLKDLSKFNSNYYKLR